jgi:hypothetical protein
MNQHPILRLSRSTWATVLLFALVIAQPGCASLGGPVAGTGPTMPYPAWVKAGSHLEPEGPDRGFMGLGAVRGIRNVALSRSTADNRARADLARLLDGFVAVWVQDTPAVPPADQAATVKLLTAISLSGVQMVEHYFHPDDGSVYSLAKLTLSHVVQHMQAQAELPHGIKKELARTSDGAYNRLLHERRKNAASP